MSTSLLLLGLVLYLFGAASSLAFSKKPVGSLRVSALFAVLGGAAGCSAGFYALFGGPLVTFTLPWEMLGERLTLGVDPLSGLFLLPLCFLGALFSIYGVGYLRGDAGKKPLGVHGFLYNTLLFSMALLLTARNGALFLFGWEVMSLTSFFLVAHDHEKEEVRNAARIYLIATHLGGLMLLLFFTLLARETGSMDLNPIAARELSQSMAWILFSLAVVGFGAKAGIWPLHVWLPKAHPAAPSHVSALLSAVMVKTGVYGVARVLWLFGPANPGWGAALVVIGVISAVVGSLFALGQRDVKALLAYCTVENVGIIFIGLGVGCLGSAWNLGAVAAAGFAGAFLHVVNHALFKGLLFMGAGSVVHGTGERDMEKLGGLLKVMPKTGGLFLVGSVAIAALPPFNGLVSEFLIFLGLFASAISVEGWHGLSPLFALPGLALSGALALAAFAKLFSVVFLGAPRSETASRAHDPGRTMLYPMGAIALVCAGVGLLPGIAARIVSAPVGMMNNLAGRGMTALMAPSGPLSMVGYVSAGLLLVVCAAYLLARWLLKGREVGESPTWDCGYGNPTRRMQYTGTGFSLAVTAMFGSLIKWKPVVTDNTSYFPREGNLNTTLSDTADTVVWTPAGNLLESMFLRLRFMQGGRLQLYLLVIFVTLVTLLAWALVKA